MYERFSLVYFFYFKLFIYISFPILMTYMTNGDAIIA